jgi:TolA-binding protein
LGNNIGNGRFGDNIGNRIGNNVIGSGNLLNQRINNGNNFANLRANYNNWGSGNSGYSNWGGDNSGYSNWGGDNSGYSSGASYPSYYPQAYGNWYSGSWSGWDSQPAAWAGGAALGSLGAAAADNFTYSNPYVQSTSDTVVQPVYNYSQPITAYTEPQAPVTTGVANYSPAETSVESQPAPATPSPTAVPPPAEPTAAPPADDSQPTDDPAVKAAVPIFDEGRELFKKGDYAGAEAKVGKAIGILPQDRVLHEFRALVLFAEQKYPDAASTLYAVVASGPGWNWETLSSYYPDVDVYTRQLRALEAHTRANPKSADDHFVLAYHYLVMGKTDNAIKMLERVTNLLPKDQLSAQILSALKSKRPEAAERRQDNSG